MMVSIEILHNTNKQTDRDIYNMMVSIEILHNPNKQTYGDIYNMMVSIEILHNTQTNKPTDTRRYHQHDGQYRNIT